jgi:hypothetical protein
VEAEGGVSVFVTVHLIHVADDETEEIQFSGRAGPFVVNGVPVSPDVPIVRGPLDNLAVTSVSVASVPAALPLGASSPVAAAVEAADGAEPVVFWTSLDPALVSVAGTTITAAAVGTARLVASAGSFADTVSVQVLDPDSVPPALVETSPTADQRGAPRGQAITATFDEPIDPGSAAAGFVLVDSLNAPVAATVSVSGSVVSLTPDAPLEAEHRYTATLGAEISDLSGNVLGDPISWSFTTGGQATLGGAFDPTLGTLVAIALDDVTGELYLHDDFNDTIRVFDQAGNALGPTLLRPGLSSNDIDLDFTTAPVSLGSTPLPTNTLIVHNGEVAPGTLFAMDKTDGTVLDSMSIANGGIVVGGAFHPGRGTWFAVSWDTNTISEVELETAAILNAFPVEPAGSPPYQMFYGDLEIDPVSGNILLVSSNGNTLRVLTPVGAWVEDYDLGVIGVTGMSGIAWNGVDRTAWIASTTGFVFRVDGIDPG